jgi:glucosamine 6-phosphate synthetase-like amidotransferase/phosphosugar isomerase protein
LTSDSKSGIVAIVPSEEAAPQLLMQGEAGHCGIGHTRRAMHDRYLERNAHYQLV